MQQPDLSVPPHGPASEELVEHVAAAFHTLMRSWRFPGPASERDLPPMDRPVSLESWLVSTNDPRWLHPGRGVVDLAGTPWHALPADWKGRFLSLGRTAADAVVNAVTVGRRPAELDEDPAFQATVAERLRRPWLAAPRIRFRGELLPSTPPELLLARVAIHTYAARLIGPTPVVGSIPTWPPPAPVHPHPVRTPDEGMDERFVTLQIFGEDLDPADLTAIIGHAPDWSNRRGDLNISYRTGHVYRPYVRGEWRLTSDGWLDRGGTTIEDHLGWLLDVVEPQVADVAAYVDRHRLDVVFSTFSWQARHNAEWHLSAATLRRMARLRARFFVDSYIASAVDDGSGDADEPAD